MKQIIFVLGLLSMFACNAFSQAVTPPAKEINDAAARTATEQLTTKYGLTADQAKQMYTIQLRKHRNFSEIESLKTGDPAKYNGKVASIQKGTLASIKRLLNNKDQIQLFQKTQIDVRVQRANKRKELLSKGMQKPEVEAALLLIYAE
jgi:hypothetical protein